jgi:hypothetical protein
MSWKDEVDMKYIVIKHEDAENLSPREQEILKSLLGTIYRNREEAGKSNENQYLVINQDEPYAEEVWNTIHNGEVVKIKKHNEELDSNVKKKGNPVEHKNEEIDANYNPVKQKNEEYEDILPTDYAKSRGYMFTKVIKKGLTYGQAMHACVQRGSKVTRAVWKGYWRVGEFRANINQDMKVEKLIMAVLREEKGWAPATPYTEDIFAEDWMIVE